MNKTPVSILQELMTKRGCMPNYELLLSNSEGIGTHMPIFYYRVTVEGVQAVGKGGSKKEAKHEAARLVLEKLHETGIYKALPANCPGSPIPCGSPDPVSPIKTQINAIGALQDLCTEKNIPHPEFILLSDVGPAHLRQFTIECQVSTMTVTATDTTKKRARQAAAQKMLHRLIDTLPEEIEEMSFSTDNSLQLINHDELVKEYNEVSTLTKKKMNWGLKVADFPKSIKNLMEEHNCRYIDLWLDVEDESLEEMERLLAKLELHSSFEVINQGTSFTSFLTIDSEPEFILYGLGKNEEEAKQDSLEQLYEFLKVMTK